MFVMTDYAYQRLRGAKAIITEALTTAQKFELANITCIWDDGREIADSPAHILVISSGATSVRGSFTDEELADFPGKVGTESTKQKLHAMLYSLSKDQDFNERI